jgi:inosine/xanthosine triphosphate pyrophosphatase family protein
MASLEASLKNKISHRAIAAQLFLKELDKDRS